MLVNNTHTHTQQTIRSMPECVCVSANLSVGKSECKPNNFGKLNAKCRIIDCFGFGFGMSHSLRHRCQIIINYFIVLTLRSRSFTQFTVHVHGTKSHTHTHNAQVLGNLNGWAISLYIENMEQNRQFEALETSKHASPLCRCQMAAITIQIIQLLSASKI